MRWYKRNSDAFSNGVAGLTLEEVGAYTLVLDAIYSRDGDLPNDDNLIARLLRCDVRIWRRLRLALVSQRKIWVTAEAIGIHGFEWIPTYAYIVGKLEGPSKIGITSNLSDRVRVLQTGCPFNIDLFWSALCRDREAALCIESEVLGLFSIVRAFGEWIDAPPRTIIAAIEG
jgi:hypothetical protein